MKMMSARDGRKSLLAPLPAGPALEGEARPTGAVDVVSGSGVGIARCLFHYCQHSGNIGSTHLLMEDSSQALS